MTQLTMKDQLKKLLELQNFDKDIYEYKKELTEQPAALEELKTQFEAKKSQLQSAEDKLKHHQAEHQNFELELQTKEGDIASANAKLSQLKTNKEYQAMLLEIENFEADKAILEEKILASFDETEVFNKQIEEEKQILAEEQAKYEEKKKEVEALIADLGEKVKQLEMKRDQAKPGVDAGNLSVYERILNNKDGIAVVPVNGNSCGGCFMNVTPQMINEIKKHDKLVMCESCARILYLEEDLE